MSEEVNKSIASTLNTKIRTSWVWLVLAITVGLTILFYFSQKQQVIAYSGYTKSLSDYLLQESAVLRTMDRIRLGQNVDEGVLQSQTTTLREMVVSFSREMDENRRAGEATPSVESISRFEKEALGKISRMRRYASRRVSWFDSYSKCYDDLFSQSPSVQRKMKNLLDSARAGYLVVLNSSSDEDAVNLPEDVRKSLVQLFQENEELYMAWNSFDNGLSMAYSEDLMNFFKMESLNEISLKDKIPMAFYFLSLVLLLSTFFFVLYARR